MITNSLDTLFKTLKSFKTVKAREEWIEPRITPPTWVEVVTSDGILLLVSNDYMGIDGCPLPMSAPLATRVARTHLALLPTKVLVDQIVFSGNAHRIHAYEHEIRNIDTWKEIHEQCLKEYGPPGELRAGHRKDVIRHPAAQDRLVIYGWHGSKGGPIQKVNNVDHDQMYMDYSHGIRLVTSNMGVPYLENLYRTGHSWVSDVGPIAPEYPPMPKKK